MDERGRHLVYSVTKTFLGVLCLRLDLDLEAPVATWIDDERLPRATLRQLLNHTSGIPDYGRLPEYGAAVRDTPSEPWSDEELLARSLAGGPDFAPGEGWAYSNTGFLLVRRIVDLTAAGGFAGALERELLGPLGLSDTSLALELATWTRSFPAGATRSATGAGTSEAATTRAGSGTARSPRRAPTNAASGARLPPASSAISSG